MDYPFMGSHFVSGVMPGADLTPRKIQQGREIHAQTPPVREGANDKIQAGVHVLTE